MKWQDAQDSALVFTHHRTGEVHFAFKPLQRDGLRRYSLLKKLMHGDAAADSSSAIAVLLQRKRS